ncbi:unnamed protein product, partial [Vitis vinifera]
MHISRMNLFKPIYILLTIQVSWINSQIGELVGMANNLTFFLFLFSLAAVTSLDSSVPWN